MKVNTSRFGVVEVADTDIMEFADGLLGFEQLKRFFIVDPADETLILWGGEFGRTPVADGRYPDKPAGRDHNPYGFTTWLAGGGVKGGKVIGATDEFGFRAVTDPVHVNDLHATVLRMLGLDHRRLTFLFQGRDQRLTDVGGDREFADRLLSGG